MRKLAVLLLFICLSTVLIIGCSKDIMYGPKGEIIKMKSPSKKMKITIDDDEIEIKGARGIGGQSRVRMPAVPVETGEEPVGIHGVMVPAPPAKPVLPASGVSVETKETTSEQQTIVH